ncbi:Leucine Rich Repeat [Novymonas esmeraldas]|uniref:Leucine Rich Repeat n=1 Tax=Novymonas esmeraldas TaxID=1808958 RepID=A0AAW0EUN6_9TRYP
MSISLERRGIYELGEEHPRRYGLTAAAVAAAVELHLDHNHLRTLQRPFARPAVVDTSATAAATSAAATGTPESLAEQSSAVRLFTSLAQLFVSHNQLRSLSGLCGVADTLTVLVATHNALTSLDGMQACRRLTYVDLSNNSIESLHGLPLLCAAPPHEAVAVATTHDRRRLSARAGDVDGAGAATAAANADADDAQLEHVSIVDAADVDERDRSRASIATASVSLSFQTLTGADAHPQLRGAGRGPTQEGAQQQQTLVPAAAGASGGAVVRPAARPRRSGDTSIQFDVDDTLLPMSDAGDGSVTLLLAHNRLRGRALSCLAARDADRHDRHRPWCATLTHLDISHNYLEDLRDARQLCVPTRGAAAPVLPRLRRLDISGNPALVNGSLAEELARATAPPSVTHTSARRPTLAPAADEAETRVMGSRVSPLPVQFRVHYTSRLLEAALRAPAPAPVHGVFADVAAARDAMEALLTSLAVHWQRMALPSTATATAPMAASPCLVELRGSELSVLAAALQQRGVRLGDTLEARMAVAPPAAPGRLAGHGGSAAMSSVADADASVFLTPPPRRMRAADVNVASSAPPAQRSAERMNISDASRTPARAAADDTRSAADDDDDDESVTTTAIATTDSRHIGTSAVGYRVLRGRGQTRPAAVDTSASHSDAAAVHVSSSDAARPTAARQPSADAVELQLLRAEVTELRRRYRELQRQTRDQTCVLQRQEAAMRELKTAAALTRREQQEAQAGLKAAHREIERLREHAQALSAAAAAAAREAAPTSSTPPSV